MLPSQPLLSVVTTVVMAELALGAVGAVGIVPVILRAFKGSQKLCRGISNFKNYTREVKNFGTTLGLERIRFNELCVDLLNKVVDRDEAIAMLQNDHHQLWYSHMVQRGVEDLFHPNWEVWLSMIRIIEEKQSELDERWARLAPELKDEKVSRICRMC